LFGSGNTLQALDIEALADIRTTTAVTVLRLDPENPVTGGNKSYKLKYNLLKAIAEGYSSVLTFGGPFSNHIAATAAAAHASGLRSIGIIRGEKVSNPTLLRAAANGMQLIFTDRSSYRNKTDSDFLSNLRHIYGNPFIIPEGGSSEEGVLGCEEILDGINIPFDTVVVACGTGATLAGIIRSSPSTRCIGISVLRDGGSITETIQQFLGSRELSNWSVMPGYDFGGYAKTNPELNAFVNNFIQHTSIPIEPVYTGKMFYGLLDMIKTNKIPEGSKVLAVHTGGMQYLQSNV
jgi:1-aminocyclopropane-1-carboxylate deaminase